MAEPVSYDDFAKLELRVAKVLEARPHPNADKLLLLQVDVGDQQKQIVAGIHEHYTPKQLVGKLIGGTVGPGRSGDYPQRSGKEVTSPPPPPLRTAREVG